MAGIYLHIPFCKQACHYCNFHFSTSLKYKEEMVKAMLREIEMQADYLDGETVETIYLGGGTPSLLDEHDLEQVFNILNSQFSILNSPEITLEANPDDLTKEKLSMLRKSPVNRLSIGIQSFSEEDLKFMNRAHNAKEATACLENALAAGFDDLSIDLIYGSPTTSDEQWEKNLATVISFDVQHISSYCLTVEPQTALDHFVKKGMAKPVDEEQSARQFEMLMAMTEAAGYEHYEISNFAKPGKYSRHNSSYWQGKKYLGIGPSAHSFNGESRQWNVANNAKYMRSISENKLPFEKEMLTPEMQYNEFVMTGLRTKWGVSISAIRQFGSSAKGQNFEEYFLQHIQPYIEQGIVEKENDVFRLTKDGRFLADGVAAELFA